MKKLLFFFFFCSPALGADYYFSDCATGGAGTIGDPYCLDPDSDGINESIDFLMDGTGAEVVAGDTMWLCAGACDGSGTSQYNLESSGSSNDGTFAISPEVDGTEANPITIQVYAGETVALSGDSNNDDVNNDGLSHIITDDFASPGKDWYVWRGMIIEQSSGHLVELNSSANVWFDQVTMRQTGGLFGGGDFNDGAGCDSNVGATAFKTNGITGFFKVTNSVIHTICGFAHRNTVNPSPDLLLAQGNEYYNVGAISNDFIGDNHVYRGNYAHSVRTGISIEQNMTNVIVEDNVIACLDDYKVQSDGRCTRAIGVSNGDGASPPFTSQNIIVRRNTIIGLVDGIFAGANVGWWIGGIRWTASNTAGDLGDSRIENNVVIHAHHPFAATDTALWLATEDPVIVQNNTLWSGEHGLVVNSGTGHTIRGNIIGEFNELELEVKTDGNTVEYNNVYDATGTIAEMGVSQTAYTCANFSTFGSNNVCVNTIFTNTTGSRKYWDLSLHPNETFNVDIEGLVGPLDDRTKALRDGLVDRGAYEVRSKRGVSPRRITRQGIGLNFIGSQGHGVPSGPVG